MSVAAITFQLLLVGGLLLLPLIPSERQTGAMLVWGSADIDAITTRSGAHWGGLNGPFGTRVLSGSVSALRAEGAFVLLNLDRLATLCGVQT